MKNLQYKNLEDFILDETFREFVADTNPSAKAFWKRWADLHPDKKEAFTKATEVMKILLSGRKKNVPLNKSNEWAKLLSKIESTENFKKSNVLNVMQSVWFRIAAVIILSFGLSVLWNWVSTIGKVKFESTFCEVIVPIGEKSQIILPDGTHVWINSGSSFKYPTFFGEKSREVFLQGEAYFDVTKQNGKTFVVNTSDVKVRVLGTAFNVKCYPGDSKTSTTVVRGLVQVETLIGKKGITLVKPSEMAVIMRNTSMSAINLKVDQNIKPILINHINTEAVTSWKDHFLIFSDEPLADMAVKMERWFNVKIFIADEKLRAERYNGKFVRNETIYQVLEAIKLTTPITYKLNNNEIIITHK